MHVRPTRFGVVFGAILSSVALAVPFGATSGATQSESSKIAARVGPLEVIDPFLPNPASPTVAAIYLTVKNTGSRPDEFNFGVIARFR